MRVLVTGFGPFPGIPVNPSAALARYLVSHRRVRYAKLTRNLIEWPTEWAMLRDVATVLEREAPDVVLMFGVAGRRRKITPETRLVPYSSTLKPDAAGAFADRSRHTTAPVLRPCVVIPPVLTALSSAGVPAQASRDAGRYLCNALAYEMLRITAGRQSRVLFVHIPMPQGRLPSNRVKRRKPSKAMLRRGAVAILDALLLQARRHS
jgi:pyroglutamyl-peptidase